MEFVADTFNKLNEEVKEEKAEPQHEEGMSHIDYFRLGSSVGYEIGYMHGVSDGYVKGWNSAIRQAMKIEKMKEELKAEPKKSSEVTKLPQEEIQNCGNINSDFNI